MYSTYYPDGRSSKEPFSVMSSENITAIENEAYAAAHHP
jgi:hypothetical protein